MKRRLRIALAGNANVGKSVIFNQMTGLHQHIGNWPGKTIEKAEGSLFFKDREIDVIDLPGIYSLSTYSLEEVISREYIMKERPDVVINVVDASVLERNLYFTLQLMELGRPLVIALNQVDMAEKKGVHVDHVKLGKLLGVPVVPTVAVRNLGIAELLAEAVQAANSGKAPRPPRYGSEIEKAISSIERKLDAGVSRRWTAIKLLQGDDAVRRDVRGEKALREAEKVSRSIESVHRHSCQTAMACEIYGKAATLSREVQQRAENRKRLSDAIDDVTAHPRWGYPVMAAVLLASFFIVFTSGNIAASAIEAGLFDVSGAVAAHVPGIAGVLLSWIAEGLISAAVVVLPYILPFYIILGLMETSGYMARAAFLMDKAMHKIGLHGKAFIPIMMGFGCNVPACLGCRIMETHRERMIAVFVVTLIPCAAVTTVILGLVGRHVGLLWALSLYVIDALIVLALGRLAFRVLPGEPSGLIMEMPAYRVPHAGTVLRQAWFRVKEFCMIAIPVILAGTVLIKLLEAVGMLEAIAASISPVTVGWLGLPAMAGVLLILGILKKELTLVMLAAYAGTTNFALVMSPVQMIVFALVTMLYIPCAATIAALVKETGWRNAAMITAFEIAFAVLVGGVAFRLLVLFGI